MSNEALTWALNLAPVPLDQSGTPSGACASVLMALANHADPDGSAAFPAISTMVRYTRMSERTIRSCLRRLEEIDVIKPCSPAVVAAKIPRPDRRPNGYDLDLGRIRDDLSEEEMIAIARSNKMLRPAINEWLAARGAPVAARDRTGGNERSNGGQLTHERGAVVAPEPSIEPPYRTPPHKQGAQKSLLEEKPSGLHTLQTYLDWCVKADVPAVSETHAAYKRAAEIGLSEQMLALAWSAFERKYTGANGGGKKYKRWDDAFEECVMGNWFDLWRPSTREPGTFYLTTAGQQEKASLDAASGEDQQKAA